MLSKKNLKLAGKRMESLSREMESKGMMSFQSFYESLPYSQRDVNASVGLVKKWHCWNPEDESTSERLYRMYCHGDKNILVQTKWWSGTRNYGCFFFTLWMWDWKNMEWHRIYSDTSSIKSESVEGYVKSGDIFKFFPPAFVCLLRGETVSHNELMTGNKYGKPRGYDIHSYDMRSYSLLLQYAKDIYGGEK